MIPIITPEEAAELTYYGSEVIHPFTLEQIIKVRIPIRIKNVINPSGDGTVVLPGHPDNAPPTPAKPILNSQIAILNMLTLGDQLLLL